MGFLKAFKHDCFTVAPPQGDLADHTLNNISGRDLQERLQRDGYLRVTVVSGGEKSDRNRVLMSVLRQAHICKLPAILLTADSVSLLPGKQLYNYDPFHGHTKEEAAFLLSRAADLNKPGFAKDIHFSLNALLRDWEGHSLDKLLACSCEEEEQRAQQCGFLPFAERGEFRAVFDLLIQLKGLQPSGQPGMSVKDAVQTSEQLVLRHPLLWMMALAEIEEYCPQALIVCADAPFARLPDRLEPLVDHGHVVLSDESLPAQLSDNDWMYLGGRMYTSVMFAHASGMAAEKVAQLYGTADIEQNEYSQGITKDWLLPWNSSITKNVTTHIVRQYQVRPEIIQRLAPGWAVVSCGGARRVCRLQFDR